MNWTEIFDNLNRVRPTVHCITNYVTINDCANVILAAGGKPTMADRPEEAAEITEHCQSLVINMGTPHSVEGMFLAGKKSNACGHPVILDPVGVGASSFRRKLLTDLEKEVRFSVIRGNLSEIRCIATGTAGEVGVEVSAADALNEKTVYPAARLAGKLSEKTGAVIIISGPIDIVASSNHAYLIRNGHPIMSRITGAGCMLSAMLGAFAGANPDRIFDAAAACTAAMGVCGERAWAAAQAAGGGTMTFRMKLIDEVSLMSAEKIRSAARMETYTF